MCHPFISINCICKNPEKIGNHITEYELRFTVIKKSVSESDVIKFFVDTIDHDTSFE